MEKLDKVIRVDEVKVELKKFRSWFDGPVQTPQDKLAKAVIKQCIEIIDKLKPVEAEPIRHARWVIERWSSGYIKRCNCSNCGNHPKDAYAPPKFCDNCGAHMDEEVADGT